MVVNRIFNDRYEFFEILMFFLVDFFFEEIWTGRVRSLDLIIAMQIYLFDWVNFLFLLFVFFSFAKPEKKMVVCHF